MILKDRVFRGLIYIVFGFAILVGGMGLTYIIGSVCPELGMITLFLSLSISLYYFCKGAQKLGITL